MNSARRLASLSCLALAAGAAAAHADVETAFYWNDQLFKYTVNHMPDLDQQRAAAPGILGLPQVGSTYAGPTSALNLMVYCANHGFPEVWPGPGNYQQNGLYDVATLNILALGFAMGTDENGTDTQAIYAGAKSWLSQAAPGKFTVSTYATTGNYVTTLSAVAKCAIHGAIVSICYGRYSVIGSTQSGLDIISRDGGHCVTLTHAMREGDDQEVAVRNSWSPDDGMLTTQSAFGNSEVEVTDRMIAYNSSAHVFTMSALSYDAADEQNSYIDRYIAIKPKLGYTWQPSPLTISTAFNLIKVAGFLGDSNTGSESFAIEGTVIDAIIAPDQTSMLMVLTPKAGGATELHELDLLDGKVTKIATVPGAKSVHFSRHRTLYVAAPSLISMVDLVEKKVVGTAVPPFPVEAIACDDKADELVLLCSDAKKLLRWKEGLGGAPKVIDLPTELVMGGKSTIAIDPTDYEVFFATEKSPALISVTDDGTIVPCVKTWNLPGAAFPTALDLDDMGHLFAASGGKLHEMALSGEDWSPVSGSPYTGESVGDEIRVTRSRNNYDAATMSGPGWNDIDPSLFDGLVDETFVPDCAAPPANLEYGAGKAGTLGVPHLAGQDLPTLGKSTSIQLSNGKPGAMPVLLLGTQSAALPFDGGLIHLVPSFVFPIPVPIGADGTLTIPGTLPGDAALCGFTLYHQMLFADPGAPGFYHTALTNGLARTFGS